MRLTTSSSLGMTHSGDAVCPQSHGKIELRHKPLKTVGTDSLGCNEFVFQKRGGLPVR